MADKPDLAKKPNTCSHQSGTTKGKIYRNLLLCCSSITCACAVKHLVVVWSCCQHQEAKVDAKWRNGQCGSCQASLPLHFTISDDVLRVRPLLHFHLPNPTQNSLLANPSLEPYKEGDSGKWSTYINQVDNNTI